MSRWSLLSWVLFISSALCAQADLVPVHEYYGGGSGFHFYTTSTQEGTNVGYAYNGIAYKAFNSQEAGTVPLYRYSHYLGLFIYTTNYDEFGSGAYGYTYNGVQCYVRQEAGEGSLPLYRFMNRTTGNRYYTIAPQNFFGYQYIIEENPDYDSNSDWDYDGYDDYGNYMYTYTQTNIPNLGNAAFAYEGIACYVWDPSYLPPAPPAPPPQANLIYKIESTYTLDVLDLDGYYAVHYTNYSGPKQRWAFQDAGNGAYIIRNMATGNVLDLDGYHAVQAGYYGGPYQHWTLEDGGSGTNIIRNAGNGNVLDLDGYYAVHYPHYAGPKQRWRLLPIETISLPVCDSVTSSSNPVVGTSYAVYANNVQNAQKVQFITWTDANGQDDITTTYGTYNAANNRWLAPIYTGQHGNESGAYTTHVYGIDVFGVATLIGAVNVSVTYQPPPPPTPPAASVSASRTSSGIGQSTTFTITASSGSGLSELGLLLCDASGAELSEIGTATASSSNAGRSFTWRASEPGNFYFKGYAWNADRSQIAYTTLRSLVVVPPNLVTQHLNSDSWINYYDGDSVQMGGNQDIVIDSVTGYVRSGRLANNNDQYLDYGPNRDTLFLKNSLMKFDGGYVSDGYMNNQSTSVSLYYGPGRRTDFAGKSHIKFSNGYVSDGYMENQGDSESLYYGDDRTANFAPRSHIRFSGGYVSDGYMKNSGTYVYLYYGSDRRAQFLPNCHMTFAGGYASTGYLISGTSNYYYKPGGGTISIENNPVVNVDAYAGKKAVSEIVGKHSAAMLAITKAIYYALYWEPDGSAVVDSNLINEDKQLKKLIDILDAGVTALNNLPVIYSKYNNLNSTYSIKFEYPPIAFTPGADGKGYIALGKLAYNTTLTTKTGNVYVPAGTVCAFIDGAYVP